MGFPKLLLESGGQPAVRMMIQRLRSSGWGRVALVISEPSLLGFARRHIPEVTGILNPHPGRGMISSLRLGLDWAGSAAMGLLAWPVDHPLVSTATLAALRRSPAPDAVCIPVHSGRRGHPTWWGREIWPLLRSSRADHGAREILRDPGVKVLELAVDDPGVLWNINTTADATEHDLRMVTSDEF
jgi:molybdenum cofactor cytidylyltransferase